MPMIDHSPQNNKKQDYARWLGFGIEFGGTIAVFCYIGYKLDEVLNTSPWLLLAGFFTAFIGMLYLIFKQTRNIKDKQ